jgi:carboxymethylenebutenolidase
MQDWITDETGTRIPGHYMGAGPAGIVLLHDIWGLTNQMKGVGRKFAAQGFSVFLPDNFDGKTTDDETKGGALVAYMSWKAAIERIRKAVTALGPHGQGGKVAVAGFGLGGAMALSAASQLDGISACVSWYGIPTVDKGDLNNIRCKVQGHFGNQDKKFTRDRVDAFEAKLKAANIDVQILRYHTVHFFFNEMRKHSHSPHNTEVSYQRALAFLKAELGGGW